jgi:predicted small lipoprotein YifL
MRGAQVLSRFFNRPFISLALIGVFAAALTLAGCGRKGPLDPPPAASVTGEQGKPPSAAATAAAEQERLKKKHFVLDPMLN